MTTSYEGRLGTAPEEAIKAPCVVAATTNITLSGEQTINGVAVVAGDRVLVTGQTTASENGIYDVSASTWTRSTDWNDAQDVVKGQLVSVPNAIYVAAFSGSFIPGTTSVAFSALGSLPNNLSIYQTGTEAAAASHPNIKVGDLIHQLYYDANYVEGSDAWFKCTNAAASANRGWPNSNGYFYDADGKQFENISGLKNICQWGAIPDSGTTDNITYIQAAVNYLNGIGGGKLKVPAPTTSDAYYGITTPVYVKSGVIIEGDGKASYIKNTRTTSAVSGDNFVFLCGNYASNILSETFYTISSASAGAHTITCATASQAGNFSAGDIVFLKSAEDDGSGNPDFQQVNEVVSAVAGTGVITLVYPLYDALAGTTPAIGKSSGTLTDAMSNAVNAVKDAGVKNVRLEQSLTSGDMRITGWGGGLRCNFENIWTAGYGFPVINGMAHCTYKGIHGTFTSAVMEFAYFCHDTSIEGDYALDSTATSIVSAPLTCDGQSHHNLIGPINADMGTLAHSQPVAANNCHHTRFRDLDIKAQGATIAMFAGLVTAKGNILSGCMFAGGTPTFAVKFSGTSPDNLVEGNQFACSPGSNAANFDGATDNIVRGNRFDSGAATFTTSASGNMFVDNHIGSGGTFNLTAPANIVRGNMTDSMADFAQALNESGQTTVTSTTANNVLTTLTIPSGTLKARDKIHFKMVCKVPVSATTSTKDIAIRANSATIASAQLSAAQTGDLAIEGEIIIDSTTGQFSQSWIDKAGTVTGTRSEATVNTGTTAYAITLEAWLGSAPDSIVVWQQSVEVIRRYEG